MNQVRQPKGTQTGGQFAASANPESTVALAPESKPKPRKGKQVYFAVVYDEVTRAWSEDPEYMRDGQHIYDNARDNGNWEPIGEHDDLSNEAWSSLKTKLIGAVPRPTEFDAEIATCENEVARLKKRFNRVAADDDNESDDLLDIQAEIVGNYQDIARLQQAKIAALEKLNQGFNVNESIRNQILDTVDDGYDPVLRGQVSALVDLYFEAHDPGDINGLFDLTDREAEYFLDHFDQETMTLRDL